MAPAGCSPGAQGGRQTRRMASGRAGPGRRVSAPPTRTGGRARPTPASRANGGGGGAVACATAPRGWPPAHGGRRRVRPMAWRVSRPRCGATEASPSALAMTGASCGGRDVHPFAPPRRSCGVRRVGLTPLPPVSVAEARRPGAVATVDAVRARRRSVAPASRPCCRACPSEGRCRSEVFGERHGHALRGRFSEPETSRSASGRPAPARRSARRSLRDALPMWYRQKRLDRRAVPGVTRVGWRQPGACRGADRPASRPIPCGRRGL